MCKCPNCNEPHLPTDPAIVSLRGFHCSKCGVTFPLFQCHDLGAKEIDRRNHILVDNWNTNCAEGIKKGLQRKAVFTSWKEYCVKWGIEYKD